MLIGGVLPVMINLNSKKSMIQWDCCDFVSPVNETSSALLSVFRHINYVFLKVIYKISPTGCRMNSSHSLFLSVLYHLIVFVLLLTLCPWSSNNVSTLVGATAKMSYVRQSSVRQLYHIPLVTGSTVYKLSCFSLRSSLTSFRWPMLSCYTGHALTLLKHLLMMHQLRYRA